MTALGELRVKIFADGADRAGILAMCGNPIIRGFTTNPTLMREAGVRDYLAFAREVVPAIGGRPISLEVFADRFDEMERQAHALAALGENVYVKIPVTNTLAESAVPLVGRLARAGIKVNVTAMMTERQAHQVSEVLAGGPPACISIFAGRVADTGRDPVPVIRAVVEDVRRYPNVEVIWASPRELLNVVQADQAGCHIITATSAILKKLDLLGKDLDEFSLDTVKMFRDDALKAGYSL
jgi:transaldolase